MTSRLLGPHIHELKGSIMSTTISRTIVKVEDPGSRDQQLERTCALLRKQATDCGILVTRVDHSTFEIALSPSVAFGLTCEMDLL